MTCGLDPTSTASEFFDLLNHVSGSPLSSQVNPVFAALVKAQGASVPGPHGTTPPSQLILPLDEDAQAWGCFLH